MMWLNGELVEDGTVSASSAGLLLGWGVFTTVGVRQAKPLFLQRHFHRLGRDANEAQLAFDFDFETVEGAVDAMLSGHSIADGLVRLTLTARGDGRWNTQSGADFSILALETTPHLNQLSVQVSSYRVEAKRPLCGVKTSAYLPYFWAWREVRARGFDEAILLEGHGFVSEGARSTLFWMQGDVVFTPSLQTGCLRGIGRELMMEWATQSGLEVRQGQFEASEVESADEIWLVSAAAGPRRVTSWHDEDGISRTISTRGTTGDDFIRWFEERNE